MLNRLVIAAALATGLAMPALADSGSCYEPVAPAAIDGSKATEAQMQSALKDVKSFIAASDDYQSCLLSDLAEQKRQAARSKDKTPLDPSIEAAVDAKVQKNQALKEEVGKEFNASAQAYNAQHPK
ncbi:MAG TPA: hypothetical protein VG819_12925 [Rhizomicrobium sp.]|jgi:hypothetical protein|nr:hypothetical protein [Rhizomicrobium sp.]